MRSPRPLVDLARVLAELPGVGPKTAQRLALHLALDKGLARRLAEALEAAEARLGVCRVCGNLAEGELCPVCADPDRDPAVIAVVETPADVMAIEKSGEFRGRYHVLGGALNPLEGIGPDELRVEGLLKRLEGVREVLVATSMTVEGEATAVYLSERLRPFGVKVTRPAYGLPAGGNLEYVDEVTLARALAHRRPVGE